MPIRTYADVQALLNGFDLSRRPPVRIRTAPHKDFWNSITEKEFLTGTVPGVLDDNQKPIQICIPGNGEASALIQALRGAAGTMFDPTSGSIGRMPADGGPFMDDASIQSLSDWISAQVP